VISKYSFALTILIPRYSFSANKSPSPESNHHLPAVSFPVDWGMAFVKNLFDRNFWNMLRNVVKDRAIPGLDDSLK